MLDEVQAPLLRSLLAELDDLTDVRDLIERTLIDEPRRVRARRRLHARRRRPGARRARRPSAARAGR